MRLYSYLKIGFVVVGASFLHQGAPAATIPVDLGAASSFAILAYSGITDVPLSSTITGNVGLSPTTGAGITGLTAGQVSGTIYTVDGFGPVGNANNPGLLTTAKNNLSTAFTDAAGRTPTISYGTTDQALDGLTLFSGVYNFGHAATANLGANGVLTLDGQNNPNAVWIFQATSDLITGSGSKVNLINGAAACNVFWVVDSSATLGTGTDFVGTIMAYASIGLNTGARLDGRALAETAAVTLDKNTISNDNCAGVPEGGSTLLLLGCGLAPLFAFRRRIFSRA